MSALRIQVQNIDEVTDVLEEEYRVNAGRSLREQDCGFGLRVTHPEVGSVRDLPFAINQPHQGLVLIRVPDGMIAFNRLERRNIEIKRPGYQIVLQPEHHVIFKHVNDFKDWTVKLDGNWLTIESTLKDLFAGSTQLPPSTGYQFRVNLQPDVQSFRLRLGPDAPQHRQLSFEIGCFKLPINQTWYFNIKLATIAPNVLMMKEPRRTLILNQTKNDIQLEHNGTFWVINSKGTGMFECLNWTNARGYAIHVSGQEIRFTDAICRLLAQEVESHPSTSRSVPLVDSETSVEDSPSSAESSSAGEDTV